MNSMPGYYTFPIVANPTLFQYARNYLSPRHSVEQATNYIYGTTGSSFNSSKKGFICFKIDG